MNLSIHKDLTEVTLHSVLGWAIEQLANLFVKLWLLFRADFENNVTVYLMLFIPRNEWQTMGTYVKRFH